MSSTAFRAVAPAMLRRNLSCAALLSHHTNLTGRCVAHHIKTHELLNHNVLLNALYQLTLRNELHTSCSHYHMLDSRPPDQEEKEYRLTKKQESIFEDLARQTKVKNSATFKLAVAKFAASQPQYRRGHVEFLYAAMKQLKPFGVEKDLMTYKLLLDIFPKGKMVAQTMWQVEMMHYPKQQQCCIDILDRMESNGVIPDDEMGGQLVAIFGKRTHAFRKYQRMMYWMPKFKYANPYYVPHQLPEDPVEIATLALKRMAVDLQNAVTIFRPGESPEPAAEECAYIASAQSPTQRQLLAEQPDGQPVFVEGGFPVWLRGERLLYFVLRSEPTALCRAFADQRGQEQDDTTFKFGMFEEESGGAVSVPPSAHEQEDGTVLGLAITATASKASLMAWVRCLEADNPRLAQLPVVFLLRTPEAGLVALNEGEAAERDLQAV